MPSCFKIINASAERLADLESDVKRHFGKDIIPILKNNSLYLYSEKQISELYLETIISELNLKEEKVLAVDSETTWCIAIGNSEERTLDDIVENFQNYERFKFFANAETAEKTFDKLSETDYIQTRSNHNVLVLFRIIKDFVETDGEVTLTANTISETIVKIHINCLNL